MIRLHIGIEDKRAQELLGKVKDIESKRLKSGKWKWVYHPLDKKRVLKRVN